MGNGALKRLGAVAVLGAAALTLHAQEPTDPHAVQPERPTVATHAGTVAPGWFEIETGIEHDHIAAAQNTDFTPTVLKLGLASHVQLSIFGSAVRTIAGSGPGDLAIGAKWRLLDDAPVVGDFAILPTLKFPTGSAARGTGTGTTDGSLLLISSHDFGGVAMDLNIGYTRRGGDGTNAPTSATLWTASFGGPFASAVGWVFETYGYPGTSGPAGQAPIVAMLLGPTVLPRSWLAFDAGLIIPVAGPQPHSLYAGGVINVGRIWGRQ